MHAWDNLKNPWNFHFSIHAHAFLIDAASASPSGQPLKALKTALADYKSEIIDVSRLPELFLCRFWCMLFFVIPWVDPGQGRGLAKEILLHKYDIWNVCVWFENWIRKWKEKNGRDEIRYRLVRKQELQSVGGI